MFPLFAIAQNNRINEDTVNKRDVLGLIKTLFHKDLNAPTKYKDKKIYYSFLPVSSEAPGAGIALVTTTTAGFYLGDKGNTFLSTVTFSPYITFSDRIGFTFRSNLW